VVTAPVSGKLVNLRVKSIGGVMRGGEPVLEIVPTEEQLLIDARVSPSDIVVTVGLAATVHLTAFSSRGLPRVEGSCGYCRPTGLSMRRLARPIIWRAWNAAGGTRRSRPASGSRSGMPAEVLIVTGERTTLAYMMEPFLAAFRRGLPET
jgi:HlyD family secretion protein/epimerase transport system membrane fusion protein